MSCLNEIRKKEIIEAVKSFLSEADVVEAKIEYNYDVDEYGLDNEGYVLRKAGAYARMDLHIRKIYGNNFKEGC